MKALLAADASRVICPVRARDDAHARTRIEATLHRYGIRIANFDGCITAFAADLEDPHLGRAIADYERLARSNAAVVHCAADVNWALPYDGLRAANVLATRNLLRFASTGVRKRFRAAGGRGGRHP
jgi:thioester reductase-like protein